MSLRLPAWMAAELACIHLATALWRWHADATSRLCPSLKTRPNPPHHKQSYFQSLDGYDLDSLSTMTAAGSFALGVAAAKLLRQRSMHGSAVGAPFNRQVSGASRFSVAAGRMPAAAAAAAGPADTVVVVESGAPALPSPDLISALAAVEAATAQVDSMQSSDDTEAAGLPAAASPSVEAAAAAGAPARPPRRTTFSAREYMQAAGLASLTAAAATQQQQQQQQQLAAPMQLPGLAVPSKARRASSHPGSPASMTGGQFGSLSSVETGESAATWSVNSQGTETEAGAEGGHITPEAGQTAVARAPQGALAPPPIPPLGSADDAGPASISRDLARPVPALLAQVKQLLVLPTQALPAVLARAVSGGGGAPAEEPAPGQRRRASWRGFEQECHEELAAKRQQAQQLAAALPPPAFGK